MGSFRNYGHEARAIAIVDRSLSEVAPGVYRGRVKVPVEGLYDVAFMFDSPQFLHCFNAKVVPDATKESAGAGQLAVNYEVDDRHITVGEPKAIRFRLKDAASGEPAGDVQDVTVLSYRSDGRDRNVQRARPVGDGSYEVVIDARISATYYVYVSAPSRGLKYSDRAMLSLMAMPAESEAEKESVN
jgi:hypothetical protein